MNILEKIIEHKRKEVIEKKSLVPTKLLENSIYFKTPVVSLKKYVKRDDKSGIIAEFKRRSPSKGAINPHAKVEQVSIGYMQAGASALSVLTDTHFFGGKNEDLIEARKYNFCPILRKEFIIDEYQIIEARSIGADAILLIAECLSTEEFNRLSKFAKGLGLEILMEIHSAKQIEKINEHVDLIGVNNRNLETFEVSIHNSMNLINQLPTGIAKISESGIDTPEDIQQLRSAGFDGFLIGERFMKTANPAKACGEFIRSIQPAKKVLN